MHFVEVNIEKKCCFLVQCGTHMVAAARSIRARGRTAPKPNNTQSNVGAGPAVPNSNPTARQAPGTKGAPPKVTSQVMKTTRDMIRQRGGSWKKTIETLSDEEALLILELCKKNSNRCPLNAKDRIKLIHEKFGRKSNKVEIQKAIFDVTVALKQGGAAEIAHQAAGAGQPPLDPNLTKEGLTKALREAYAMMRAADPNSKKYQEKVAKHASWFPRRVGESLVQFPVFGTIGTVLTTYKAASGGASAGASATMAVSQWMSNLLNDLMEIDSRSRLNTGMKTLMALAPVGLGMLQVRPLFVLATIISLGVSNEHMHDTQEAKENRKEKSEGVGRFIGALIARYTYSIMVASVLQYMGFGKLAEVSKNTSMMAVEAATQSTRALGASFGLVGAGASGIADIAIGLTRLIKWGFTSAPGAAVAVREGIRNRAGYARRSFTSFRTSHLGIHNKRKYFTASIWGRDGAMTISKLAAGILRLFMFRFRYFMQNLNIYTGTALAISVFVMYKIMNILLRKTVRVGVRAARGVYTAVRSQKRARNAANVTNVRKAVNATNVPTAPIQRAPIRRRR